MAPELGSTVLYKLTDDDALAVNRRRQDANERVRSLQVAQQGSQTHVGNSAREGDVFPGLVVRRWGDLAASPVNLQVFLDGNDVLWVTSRLEGVAPGQYLLA